MNPTIEARVDEAGVIRPREPIVLPPGSRLLITVLSIPATGEGALLSEEALAEDWNRPEEDQAWATLAQA